MITIIKENNEILMKAHYEYRTRLAKITGSYFDYGEKVWKTNIQNLPEVEAMFPGEIYYKTPRWKLYGLEAPPKQEIHLYGDKPSAPTLNCSMFDYQEDGFDFMVDRLNRYGFVLNSDVVGSGKTLMSLASMMWFVENQGIKRVLIITKKSVKIQWASEIEKFTNIDFPIAITGDTKKKREKAYSAISDKGILITNYHNFLNDKELIESIDWDLVIIDEVHQVKAHDGKMNNNIRDVVQGKKVILLTGTPVMSKPEDIYGIVNIANNAFGEYKDFQKRYLVMEYGIYGYQVIGAKHLDELQGKIKDFMIRRTSEEISVDLPEEMPPITIPCDMDSTQAKMKAHVDGLKNELDERKKKILADYGDDVKSGNIPDEIKDKIHDINEKSKMYIATAQFIADDPNCFRYLNPEVGINSDMLKLVPASYKMSNKTETTIELVESIVSSGEKVIIFTHFSSSAKMLKEQIEKALKEKVVLYTGEESDDLREQNISDFKNTENTNILIGTEAMAEGLNLQVAQYMIHYEQPDTYAHKEQRIGRIKRIGSNYSHITSYDICTKGSFDYVKINKIEKDKLLQETLLD